MLNVRQSYFAYGSNLSREQMSQRCPTVDVTSARRAVLRDWRLAFDKPSAKVVGAAFANVHRSPGDEVHGVIYELDAAALAELDRYEGVGGGHYMRHPVTCHDTETSAPITAITYVACAPRDGLAPQRAYLATILTGGGEHSLPTSYMEQLARTPTCD